MMSLYTFTNFKLLTAIFITEINIIYTLIPHIVLYFSERSVYIYRINLRAIQFFEQGLHRLI